MVCLLSVLLEHGDVENLQLPELHLALDVFERDLYFAYCNLSPEGFINKYRWEYNGQRFSLLSFSFHFSFLKDEIRKRALWFQISSFAIPFNFASCLVLSESFSCVCFSIHKCSLALTFIIFPLAAQRTKHFYKCNIKTIPSWFWVVIPLFQTQTDKQI